MEPQKNEREPLKITVRVPSMEMVFDFLNYRNPAMGPTRAITELEVIVDPAIEQ